MERRRIRNERINLPPPSPLISITRISTFDSPVTYVLEEGAAMVALYGAEDKEASIILPRSDAEKILMYGASFNPDALGFTAVGLRFVAMNGFGGEKPDDTLVVFHEDPKTPMLIDPARRDGELIKTVLTPNNNNPACPLLINTPTVKSHIQGFPPENQAFIVIGALNLDYAANVLVGFPSRLPSLN